MKCPTCGARYGAAERLCPNDGAVLEPEQAPEDALIGKVLDGKYRIESFLSRGGMGAVFRGTHVMLNRPVAVKLIKPELVTSPEIVRRFQREAQAATQLSHPNIVSVYDLGQTSDGTLYIVMELVLGGSLKDEIRSSGAIDAARTVRILGQVCDGLALAHRAGIVHRDLKPHNVMLTRDGQGAELAKLVDFGIAKTFEVDTHTQLTAEGSTLGTPHYMSPEQATGRDVDHRSDIYSLGIILYEMLTGDVPFNDPSLPAVLVKHLTETPKPPTARRPDLSIPAALDAIVLKCLEKDPTARYQSAEELAAALRTTVSHTGADGATIPLSAGAAAAEPTLPLPRATPPVTNIPPVPSTPNSAPASPSLATGAGAPAAPGTVVPPIPPIPAAASAPPLPPPATHGTHPTAPAATFPPPPASLAQPAEMKPGHSGSRVAFTLAAVAVVLLAVLAGTAYWALSGPDRVQPAETADSAPVADPAMATTPPDDPPADRRADQNADVTPAPPAPAPPAVATAEASLRGHPMTTAAPSAGRVDDAPGAGRRADAAAPAGTPPTAAAETVSAPQPPSTPTLPPTPTVSFACTGAGEVCGPLRAALEHALDNEGWSLRRTGADIELVATVEILEERTDNQFGTTFVVRTYSVQMEGEAPRLNEVLPTMPAQTFSADARLGRERLNENARVAAAAALERMRVFWKRRAQP